jgi:aspartate/methionine/tyrosine aminotransferase
MPTARDALQYSAMRIAPFGVEMWMNECETRCSHNLAETCVASLTMGDLLSLAPQPAEAFEAMRHLHLTYGAIEGSEALRGAIARMYASVTPAQVLVAHGAIGANALVYQALVEPGDVVVSVQPTYQQHYSIPESLGAEVRILRLRPEQGFQPDLDDLAGLIDARTRMVVLNNPNNPTGALMPESTLRAVATMAERIGAWVLCDEVYRGLDQTDPGATASIVDVTPRGISTGSMSKAFSLAGLRLGWIAGPPEVLHAAMIHRDYNTISVGVVDDYLATLALTHADSVLARSRAITRRNLALLRTWMATQPRLSWVEPQSGTTALLRLSEGADSYAFCRQLLAETGVLLTPGQAMAMEGWARIGYANHTEVLTAGLERLGEFLQKQ